MKLFERVKFQRPETGEVWDGQIAWIAEDVQILQTWRIVEGNPVGPMIVEVARQSEDGLFRRVTDFTLDQMSEDMLRTLRESATAINAIL